MAKDSYGNELGIDCAYCPEDLGIFPTKEEKSRKR